MPKETPAKQEIKEVKSTKPSDALLHDMKGVVKESTMDKKKMIAATAEVFDLHKSQKANLREAAYMLALKRIEKQWEKSYKSKN